MRIFFLFSVALLVTACGNNFRDQRGAALCTKDYSTKRLTIDAPNLGKKTKLTGETEPVLPTGDYSFKDADIFIQDTERQITLHLVVTPKVKDQSGDIDIDIRVVCVGGNLNSPDPKIGINPNMPPFVFSIRVPGQMQVETLKESVIAPALLTVQMKPIPGQSSLSGTYQLGEKSTGKLNDLYGGLQDAEQYLYETATNLELRTSYTFTKTQPDTSTEFKQKFVAFVRMVKTSGPGSTPVTP